MPDIAIVWDPTNARGDWAQAGALLQTGNDLVTAILISCLTDRIAAADDVIPDGTNDPRGWTGDLGQAYPIGSRLWLLARSKQTQEVLNRAHDYVVEALHWLLDDKVVARFDITAEFTRPGMLGIWVIAHKPDGTATNARFEYAWQQLAA
jgi:phage gp46-like protein